MAVSKCVQYGVWANCPNKCDFCLLRQKEFYSVDQQLFWLDQIENNIKKLDWLHEFSGGISLLGGELYYVKDERVKARFLQLVDTIIERILKVSQDPACRYSTVTNGLYEPSFLYQVIDRIRDAVGMEKVDVNFSYDFKYRFKNENARRLCANNIRAFRDRYNYRVGIQMILTQHVINLWKSGQFDVNKWLETEFPGCQLAFLYPHKVRTGKVLTDFRFNRLDLLEFVQYLKNECPAVYLAFIHSTRNSERFKYTGLINRSLSNGKLKIEEEPRLADGKEVKTECGHSKLYRCYADSDKCVLCDLEAIDGELE